MIFFAKNDGTCIDMFHVILSIDKGERMWMNSLGEAAFLFRQNSPCVGTDGQVSFYRFGPIIPQ